MNIIDSHAHMDLFVRNGSISEILQRASDAGVSKIITCSTSESDWSAYRSLSSKYAGTVFWQVGIHPLDVDEDSFVALDALSSYFFDDIPPVAIGEIGLDYYRLEKKSEDSRRIIELQKKFFRRQLDFARELGAKVCVHARDSFDDCIGEISDSGVDFKNVVFHCFSGSADQVRLLNSMGGRASFTGIITYKSAGEMRDAMLAQGLDRVMFETDCPYLAPIPMRGKTNEPAFLSHTVMAAAEIFGISCEEMAEIAFRNTREFFNI